MKWSTNFIALVCCVILFGCSNIEASKTQPVVASTWGWAKLISPPAPIEGPNGIYTGMQVKFQMSDAQTLTAFMYKNPSATKDDISYMNPGDQVLIASVPGLGPGGPSTTYVVIDWKAQAKAN